MNHQSWMQVAIDQAKRTNGNEVPVGAALIINNTQIAANYNQMIRLNDPTAHAEILCIREACKIKDNYRLSDATLYVTLEPCLMCFGAIVQSRIGHVVFGAADPKCGVFSNPQLLSNININHKPDFTDIILEAECQALLTKFFAKKRR